MRSFGTSEVHHQYKIWSAGKPHHQVLEKGRTYLIQYTGQIFPAFSELYLLIIFSTTGNVMYFPVKSPPGCKISLYLNLSLFAINIDIGAE